VRDEVHRQIPLRLFDDGVVRGAVRPQLALQRSRARLDAASDFLQ
jgi:hypothetical protein